MTNVINLAYWCNTRWDSLANDQDFIGYTIEIQLPKLEDVFRLVVTFKGAQEGKGELFCREASKNKAEALAEQFEDQFAALECKSVVVRRKDIELKK